MAVQRKNSVTGSQWVFPIAVGTIFLVTIAPWVGKWCASIFNGDSPGVNPLQTTIYLIFGKDTLSQLQIVFIVIYLCALVGAFLGGYVFIHKAAAGRGGYYLQPYRQAERILAHSQAPFMPVMEKSVEKKAISLGFTPPTKTSVGLPLGQIRPFGKNVYASWESTCVVIAGPRRMKTTTFAIPQICAAPGAVIATSNKVDLINATSNFRSRLGGRSWIFDPARLQGPSTQATWYWDPISFIEPSEPGGLERAQLLAEQFMFASGQFSTANGGDMSWAQNGLLLLTCLLLAAAVGDKTIMDVSRWLFAIEDREPLLILSNSRYKASAPQLQGLIETNPKTRDGYLTHARGGLAWAADPDTVAWVSPSTSSTRFNPKNFANSTDTLYLLSTDSSPTVPLVSAFTFVCLHSALAEASRNTSLNGRLLRPLVGVLDEAANICKIANLDSWYSYYGSRGIILSTLIQSLPQAEKTWGDKGVAALWAAANTRVYGGGVGDERFLHQLSVTLGERSIERSSMTHDTGRASISTTIIDKPVLDIAQLAELPPGYAVVTTSTTPAFLLKPIPFWEGPFKEELANNANQLAIGQRLKTIEEHSE